MAEERNRVVCFSGHRYYSGMPEDEARLAAAVEAAWEDGYRVFISGMAPGFDLAAAEAVVRLRDGGDVRAGGEGPVVRPVRLVAAVPFAGQPKGYSPDERARYDALLAAADEVRVLAESYSHGCYYRRDEWMVERSGRIVCWYDGGGGHSRSRSAPKANSGTRYTVRKALKAGVEIVNLFRDPDGTLF